MVFLRPSKLAVQIVKPVLIIPREKNVKLMMLYSILEEDLFNYLGISIMKPIV